MNNPEFKSPELQKEQEKSLDLAVAFLRRTGSVEKMVAEVEAASKEGKLDTVMLDEYDLKIEEVNSNLQLISELAKSKMVDIVLAADNQHRQVGDEFQQVPWEVRKKEIQNAGAFLLDEGIRPEEVKDSIGFFFSKDGSIYAFPKTWEHPIHQIPNTKIAVAVCGEISYLKPEDLQELQNIDLIYNPSREGDDPYLRYRMIGLANPNITDKEVDILLQQEGEETELLNARNSDYSNLDPHYRKLMEEMDAEEALKPQSSAEDERRKMEHSTNIKDIIQNQKNNPSMYVRNLVDVLSSKHIPVIRSDGKNTSGILNPSEAKVKTLGYHDTFTRMELSFGQK